MHETRFRRANSLSTDRSFVEKGADDGQAPSSDLIRSNGAMEVLRMAIFGRSAIGDAGGAGGDGDANSPLYDPVLK